MSGSTWPAAQQDIARLWPVVSAAHVMRSAREFSAFWEAAPWRVRVNDAGDALVVSRWREHLDVLAIRGLWCAPGRLAGLVDDARAVARAQGFGRVLSPLVTGDALDAYLALGMERAHAIVALQGHPDAVAAGAPGDVRLRRATQDDLARLEALDARCFDEFWRYGTGELVEALATERVTVAQCDGVGGVAGYASCGMHGATVTLGRLAVDPAHRRRGVARALVADVASWAARHGAFTLSLCTQEENTASRALYSAMGLSELGHHYALALCNAELRA